MKKTFAVVAALTMTLGLAGCSSAKSYEHVADLKKAFVKAGGVCKSETVLETGSLTTGENAVLKGMEGIACSGGIGIFTFPNEKARDFFIDQVDKAATQSKTGVHMVVGATWFVGGTTLDNNKFAEALGGTARY